LDHHVAQLNVALPKAALDAPLLADFVALLEPVKALADRNPPFVWRLQTEEGDATGVRALGDERLIVNMFVWESLGALRAFRLREQRARAGDGQAAGVVRAHGRRLPSSCGGFQLATSPSLEEAEQRSITSGRRPSMVGTSVPPGALHVPARGRHSRSSLTGARS